MTIGQFDNLKVLHQEAESPPMSDGKGPQSSCNGPEWMLNMSPSSPSPLHKVTRLVPDFHVHLYSIHCNSSISTVPFRLVTWRSRPRAVIQWMACMAHAVSASPSRSDSPNAMWHASGNDGYMSHRRRQLRLANTTSRYCPVPHELMSSGPWDGQPAPPCGAPEIAFKCNAGR